MLASEAGVLGFEELKPKRLPLPKGRGSPCRVVTGPGDGRGPSQSWGCPSMAPVVFMALTQNP